MPKADVYSAVRDLYNTYRTAYMNRKYYGYRLNAVQRWSSVMEIVIAVGASTTIGGLAFLQEGVGQTVWSVFGALVAILAIIKPVLQLNKQVERYTKLFIGHGDAFYDLELLVGELKHGHKYTAEMQAAYEKTIHRLRELAASDDPQPNDRLLRRCYQEVTQELPVDEFWWPKKPAGASVKSARRAPAKARTTATRKTPGAKK